MTQRRTRRSGDGEHPSPSLAVTVRDAGSNPVRAYVTLRAGAGIGPVLQQHDDDHGGDQCRVAAPFTANARRPHPDAAARPPASTFRYQHRGRCTTHPTTPGACCLPSAGIDRGDRQQPGVAQRTFTPKRPSGLPKATLSSRSPCGLCGAQQHAAALLRSRRIGHSAIVQIQRFLPGGTSGLRVISLTLNHL